jgi:hypothetical protein
MLFQPWEPLAGMTAAALTSKGLAAVKQQQQLLLVQMVG